MHKPFKKDLIDLKEWGFEFQQRGEQPILLCDWFCRAIATHFASEIGIDIKKYDYFFTDSSKGYSKPAQKVVVLKKIKDKIANPGELKKILRSSIEVPRGFNKVADEVSVAIKDPSITNNALAEYWERMDAYFIRVIPWFWYPYYISTENMLTDRVKAGLRRYREKIQRITDIDEALMLLVFPTKKTAFQTEQLAMYKLALLAEKKKDFPNDPLFQKAARAYLKKYDWLTTFILAPLFPMTYAELVRRVREAMKAGMKEAFELQKKANRKNAATAEELIRFFKEDKKLLKDIEHARELGYVLTAGIEEAYVASSRYLNFMQLVAKRINVAYEDTKFLLSQEVVGALKRGEKISTEIIDERRKGFVAASIGGQYYLSVGEGGHEISAWIDQELNKVDVNIKELRGQVACKGYAKGVVKIALEPAQAHALKEGEILVCPMTNPDYVPAMMRSAAIVTDEGGLLSHAAIMSREFGKPCVIATKIATKVLKDGDLVEVDADKGVVRILSRSGRDDVSKSIVSLSKLYTRQISLFYSCAWRDANCHRNADWLGRNIEKVLFIRPDQEDFVEGWYAPEEIDDFRRRILEKFSTEKEWFAKVLAAFEHHWRALFSFFNKETPLTIRELEDFYTHWVESWTPIAILMQIPEILELPKKIRDKSFQLREDTQEYSDKVDEVYLTAVNKAFPAMSDYFFVLTPEEVFSGKFSDTKELDARKQGWFMTADSFGFINDLSRETQVKGWELEKIVVDEIMEIRGNTAYPGKVSGIAKIYTDKKDITLLEQGEILVTTMTTPDFVPAMKRAAAIVTDEGGITSHAAIVAREMKKPCVVGTKFATKVLKDGDLVEVNADVGIVKVLKRW